ncbi:Uncharacterized protein HZ326_25524 [Fusarium oxysporum f. sp. albedinis]|nr:Uncharacterized protein HZ326_25524 [Fusarium oxysporum f. sp. albedinis]
MRDRRRKAALYSVHIGPITVSQNNRWKPCVAEFIQGPEPVQGPYEVLLSLAIKECEGDTEGSLTGINTNHIKQRHSVFVRFVCAVQEK